MIPARALLSDLGQRFVTLNKLEQKHHLTAWLRELQVPRGARLLDFGCGTGLFARTIARAGLRYCGYDPDEALVSYARRLRPDCRFVSRLADAAGPFDVVLANCCFHHIPDTELAAETLPSIAERLTPTGMFLVIDVLPLDAAATRPRRLFNVLEEGEHKRPAEVLDRLLTGRFRVRARAIRRFSLFSASVAVNPVYNEIIRYELVPAATPHQSMASAVNNPTIGARSDSR